MVPVILITSSKEQLDNWLKVHAAKSLLAQEIYPEKNSISIKQLKSLANMVSLSSGQSEQFHYLIHEAHTMTTPAQNSILKLLEEIKDNQLILLVTPNLHQLLPTIVSRCQVYHLNSNYPQPDPSALNPPFSQWSNSPEKIIFLTDQIIKSNPKEYLRQSINFIHESSRQKASLNRLQILKYLTICLSDINSNINPKLAIDQFLFTIAKYLKSS